MMMERILRSSLGTLRSGTTFPVRAGTTTSSWLGGMTPVSWDLSRTPGACRRFASTVSGSNDAAKAKSAISRRLYRILQRQCLEFAKTLPTEEGGEPLLLLQHHLDSSKDYGQSRILPIETAAPINDEDVRDILLLFRQWNDVDQDVNAWFKLVDPNRKQRQDGDNDESDSDSDDYVNNSNSMYDFVDVEPTMWTTISSLQKTIRAAFRQAHYDERTMDAKEFQRMTNKFAIVALRYLIEQTETWNLSSVSYEPSHQVRVVATSRSLGSSHAAAGRQLSNNETTKYRFAYRIRIENLSDEDCVQLLGRHWRIQEMDCETGTKPVGDPVVIDAPSSGAVGQHPVLYPGTAFEYMSGCELFNRKGIQEGDFVLAKVPMGTTSAILGAKIDALTSKADHFTVPVKPFRLEAAAEDTAAAT